MERKIIICDENQYEAKIAQDIIEKFEKKIGEKYSTKVYTDGKKLINDCRLRGMSPNIIFLDIALENGNGIEIAKEINMILPMCQIVYLSDYIEYAKDVYQTNHIYFVIKTELEERLTEIYKKINKMEKKQEDKVLRIETKKNKYVAIKKIDIVYLERRKRYTFVHTDTDVFETHLTINELEKLLYEDYFIRCHNSYIVSMKYISSYAREIITIEDIVNIPVSRRYQQEVRDKFVNWVNR